MQSPAQDILAAPVRPAGSLLRSSVEEQEAMGTAVPFSELLDSATGMSLPVATAEVMVEPPLSPTAGSWDLVSLPASRATADADRGKGPTELTGLPDQNIMGQTKAALTAVPMQPTLAHGADEGIQHLEAAQGPDRALAEPPGRAVMALPADRPVPIPRQNASPMNLSTGRDNGDESGPTQLRVESVLAPKANTSHHPTLTTIPGPSQPVSQHPKPSEDIGAEPDITSAVDRQSSPAGALQTVALQTVALQTVALEPDPAQMRPAGKPPEPPSAEIPLVVQAKTMPKSHASASQGREAADAKTLKPDDPPATAPNVASQTEQAAEPVAVTRPLPPQPHPSVQEHGLRLTMSHETFTDNVGQTPNVTTPKAPEAYGAIAQTAHDVPAARADQKATLMIGHSRDITPSADVPIHFDEVTIGLQTVPAVGASSSLHGLASATPAGTNGPSPHQGLVQQTSAALLRLANDGPGRIELTLSPETLGRVHFDMRPDATGLSITLSAERPETLDLIRRHLPDLLAELRQAGVQAGNLSFGTFGEGRHPPSGQEHSLGHDQRDLPLTQTLPLPKPVKPGIATGLDLRL